VIGHHRSNRRVINQTIQTAAVSKGKVRNVHDAGCNLSSANIGTAIESITTDAGDRSGDGHRCQGYTTVESGRSNGHDGGGDGDGR